jgi:fructokinase
VATYGGIEAGGTKVVCVVGSGPDDVLVEERFPTTDPASTLARSIDVFREHVADGGELAAVGVAAFGPVELRRSHAAYGSVVHTPKPGWSGADLVGPLRDALGVPVGFDTDVNGAALAEGRWGAALGLGQFVYLTIGTGIGGGAVVDGRLVHGLGHPELGHVAVPRVPGDDHPGSCPFHADCLEGMASGPALAARFGRPGEELDGADLRHAVELEAAYLASGLRTVVYALAPERIVVGGGVGLLPGLLPRLRARLVESLAGYPGLEEHGAEDFVVPAALGQRAGPLGALLLAEQALPT